MPFIGPGHLVCRSAGGLEDCGERCGGNDGDSLVPPDGEQVAIPGDEVIGVTFDGARQDVVTGGIAGGPRDHHTPRSHRGARGQESKDLGCFLASEGVGARNPRMIEDSLDLGEDGR